MEVGCGCSSRRFSMLRFLRILLGGGPFCSDSSTTILRSTEQSKLMIPLTIFLLLATSTSTSGRAPEGFRFCRRERNISLDSAATGWGVGTASPNRVRGNALAPQASGVSAKEDLVLSSLDCHWRSRDSGLLVRMRRGRDIRSLSSLTSLSKTTFFGLRMSSSVESSVESSATGSDRGRVSSSIFINWTDL